VGDALTLTTGERVLAAGQTSAGWLVATTDAMWMPTRDGRVRLGWELVDSASWDRDTSVLTVVPAARPDEHAHPWRLDLDDERDLLLVIKERVRATVLTSRRVLVDGSPAATVVARRPPRADTVTWAVAVDPGIDPHDDKVRIALDQATTAVRRELGL
jgi:hypothetical protein